MKWKFLKYSLFPKCTKAFSRNSFLYNNNVKTFFKKTKLMLKKDYYSK